MTSTKLNSSGDDDYLRELSPFYSFWVDGSARFCDFELFLNPFSNQPIRAHLALLYARCPKIRTLVDEGKIKSGGRLEIQMKSHQPSSTQVRKMRVCILIIKEIYERMNFRRNFIF